MKLLYDILINSVSMAMPILSLISPKLKLFVRGRRESFVKLKQLQGEKVIWFHAASLGEFEQAIPIIEKLKKEKSDHKILVTFFSPSGYEVRKHYKLADCICYLPLDTKANAKRFLEIVQPKVAIFIKYEFWPNLLNELKRNKVKTLLVSGILRENQLFFKWYGGFMRKSLAAFDHFFVQNTVSKTLLEAIGYTNVSISGDTRFDRVQEIVDHNTGLDFIAEFKNDQYIIVAGSTWPEDEALLVHYINTKLKDNEKVIIAPHNIKLESILVLKERIQKKVILYSEKGGVHLKDYQIFIIDTIGILTKVYAAADVAYVGGGLKTGLHNILEPATYGIPVVIGNKFEKFQEAKDLVAQKGCYAIQNQNEFSSIFVRLRENIELRKQTGLINKQYIQTKLGATKEIMNYLKQTV